ncbi:NADP-reducing hydrogenase subunit HndB [Clostridiales bacterium CHKCI006]|uniref:(2Fe-2S) ferredoxin domain-containing protein n=1 Tax=Candidatus Fimiplasma intestinipullorum TaxID=2840825 RepID=A0A9D1HPQ7_9FIRM|nr:NADP-reducing hydrogenase subunit HndB [Clostridiales bacterium CHKCI006]HIU13199.1 (2Fe-2S) ferredoxin domain-containing protein [Candidatus Fimiplasma intestinipullorum]
MKSLEDLKKIREEAKRKMTMRLGEEQKYRVVVGMATCGIAAGARPVLNTLVEEVSRLNIPVTVTQTGCIGLCSLEPIVEVFDAKGEKTTYVLMNSEKAKQVALKHLKNDEVVEEYTIGQYKK